MTAKIRDDLWPSVKEGRKRTGKTMAEDGLRYDRMVEDALRSVVRRALIYVAEEGLPGNHHFYITFRTEHPQVDIPEALHERYPGEMTIVLQHQFWGLEIDDHQFAVTLSFADVPHRLVVPFAAVTAFADPSVRFGLQFDVESSDGDGIGTPADGPVAVDDDVVAGEVEAPPPSGKTADGEDEKQGSGQKVVTLDTFRKK